ncbi:MAG: DUF1153 domain-containing protein [Rhodobacteraceae bacterium]|nr:DUF1153 domain-containing protein [Paracoccaceae bacterium]
MQIKTLEKTETVTLEDGTTLSRAELPPTNTQRWVASRKALVVKAIRAGLLDRGEAMKLYSISDEELSSWEERVSSFGEAALKATLLNRYRQL